MLDFATVLRAPPFQVFVGEDETCFTVPATLAKDVSLPLYNLMGGSQMKEAQEGKAYLKSTESETFVAFCEFIYTGSFRAPKVAKIFGTPKVVSGSHAIMPEQGYRTKRILKRYDHPVLVSESKVPVRFGGDRVWDELCQRDYELCHEDSEEPDDMKQNEFRPIIFHCKVYVFAKTYLAASLMQLALHRLHTTLISFRLDSQGINEVLDALEFAFDNTERAFAQKDEPLRGLLVTYVVAAKKLLKQHLMFRTLLDTHAELSSDLFFALSE